MLVFDAGADKVSVNSAALARPELITEIGSRFGEQAVVVAIDGRRNSGNPETAEVYASGGRNATGFGVIALGSSRPKLAAQEKSCSPPWIPTERATDSIAN